jgi:Family of unknown function (DUF6169)
VLTKKYVYIKKEGENLLFSFTTIHGLEYYVAFREMNFENDNFKSLYSIDFWEIYNQKFIKDVAIENTIIEIIFAFFESNPDALLHYVCGSTDNKQSFRTKLFDKWYNKSVDKEYSKLSIIYEVPNEVMSYKLEFIFKTDVFSIEDIQIKITNQLDDFSSYK